MLDTGCWIEELGSVIGTDLKLNEPLSTRTSFRIGGPVDVFVEIGHVWQLKKLISFCRTRSIPLMFIGRGTNLLVSDEGIRGVIAKLCGDFAEIKFSPLEDDGQGRTESRLTAGAAVALSRLSILTTRKGLTGLEFAFGIPGSLGGALVMNAGAGSQSIGDIVDAAEVLVARESMPVSEVVIQKDELRFEYRWSNLSEFACVTKAYLRMKQSLPEKTMGRMKQILQKKKAEQPLSAASAGCVFKNPPGASAGKLIDECGLKGTQIGGAQVSTQHANFIINTGGATAIDVMSLIDKIKSIVRQRTNIELELELRILGHDSPL